MECPRRNRIAEEGQADSHALPVDLHGAGQDRSEVLRACHAAVSGNSPSSERRRQTRRASGGCRGSRGLGQSAADVELKIVLTDLNSHIVHRMPISFPRSTGEGQDGGLNRAILRARTLRVNATDAERILWQHLRLRQIASFKFRRQRPLGPYVVDFVCLEKRLVIEVDGGQHGIRVSQDAERDAWLAREGYTVLRFWNDEVLTQMESVKNAIWSTLNAAPS